MSSLVRAPPSSSIGSWPKPPLPILTQCITPAGHWMVPRQPLTGRISCVLRHPRASNVTGPVLDREPPLDLQIIKNKSNRVRLTPDLDPAEAARRMRISRSNTGRTAWNKGRKHPPETIARIRAATQAAMKRPEVDAKVKAARFTRSPQTPEAKAKISVHAKAKMAVIREVMQAEAEKLREMMADHPDEELRAYAQGPHFIPDVMSLSWFMFRSNWSRISEVAFGHDLFLDALRKKMAIRQKKEAKEQSKAILTKAKKQLDQLRHAEVKLQILEKGIVHLRRTHSDTKAVPEQYKQAEAEAHELLESCKRHMMDVTATVKELDAMKTS